MEGQPTTRAIGSMTVRRAQATDSTAGGFPIEGSISTGVLPCARYVRWRTAPALSQSSVDRSHPSAHGGRDAAGRMAVCYTELL